jgi:signal transduction histidine kinase
LHRRNRLYWRIWFAVLAGIALVAILAGLAWKAFADPASTGAGSWRRGVLEVAVALLPGVDAPRERHASALRDWSVRLDADLALYASDRSLVASTASHLPSPYGRNADDDWVFGERGPAYVLRLADGRVLVVQRRHLQRGGPLGVVATLALIALAVSVGAWPVARRLTRRLERLEAGVNRLGGGDLAARVAVEGNDEIARLARSFNAAAARIETLVQSQRSLLANASHELRSPLARVRMALEMLHAGGPVVEADDEVQAGLRAEIRRNVAELDALIEEILLASRLDAAAPLHLEEMDLVAVAAEECARVGARLDAPASALPLHGEGRLIRRLLRNLLENAQRYGAGTPIDVRIDSCEAALDIDVCDRGPGIPASERERIFEPFYRLPGASEAAGGVGLGLALVHKIAVQHGGGVVCRPRDGGGSCFSVRLPRRPAAR